MSNEDVTIKKSKIKEGLIRELEDIRRGSTALLLVLLANADPETRLVEMTYKEMCQQTGYSKELVRQILQELEAQIFFSKKSKQGSRKTKLEIYV